MESVAPLIARFGVKATIAEPSPVATDVMAPERPLAPEPVRADPYVDPWVFLGHTIRNTGTVQSSEQTSAWTTDFIGAKVADTDGSHTLKALDGYLQLGD